MSTAASALEQKAETLANGDSLYEVVNGHRVELLPMGAFESVLASHILTLLGTYANTKGASPRQPR
jgi:hypothetical protein